MLIGISACIRPGDVGVLDDLSNQPKICRNQPTAAAPESTKPRLNAFGGPDSPPLVTHRCSVDSGRQRRGAYLVSETNEGRDVLRIPVVVFDRAPKHGLAKPPAALTESPTAGGALSTPTTSHCEGTRQPREPRRQVAVLLGVGAAQGSGSDTKGRDNTRSRDASTRAYRASAD